MSWLGGVVPVLVVASNQKFSEADHSAGLGARQDRRKFAFIHKIFSFILITLISGAKSKHGAPDSHAE